MKDGMDSTAVRRAPDVVGPAGTTEEPASKPPTEEREDFINRKLIRPSLSRAHFVPNETAPDRRDRVANGERPERLDRSASRRTAPTEQTHAESFYYQKQMQSKTPMVVVLRDGEEVQGWIEWYDRTCIKLNRNSQPNLLIYKLNIKYMYKAGENSPRR
jgi:host factor-I protein